MEKGKAMKRLLEGLKKFQNQVFHEKQELFMRLAKKQEPDTLFITCSDSRVDPNLLTQTEPGELFILRNAGNLVPPYGAVAGGTTATIEFGVAALQVKDIVVCGHSNCGALKALVCPEMLQDLPAVREWLRYAESTRRVMKEYYGHLENEDFLETVIKENVLIQLANLRTHPSVVVRLRRGDLNLHGWVYSIESGKVWVYDANMGNFIEPDAVSVVV